MNELSNLNQLAEEIRFYEKQSAQGVYEIGKRLCIIKNSLGHGKRLNWVNDNLGYSYHQANRLITVYEKYSNFATLPNLSFSKLLALTGIEDEEERKTFIKNNDVEVQTVRELTQTIKDYKDNIKAKDEEIKAKDEEIKAKDEEIESLKNRPPEIIEKEIVKEIKSSDYEYQKERAERLEKDLLNEKMKNQKLAEDKKLAISKLEIDKANKEILTQINSLQYTVLGFIREVGGLLYLTEYLERVPKDNRDVFLNSIRHLREFSEQIYKNCEEYFSKEEKAWN